jgi:hypothetical protein
MRLAIAAVLTAVAVFAQQPLTPAQALRLEAARLCDAKARAGILRMPADSDTLTAEQRVTAWVRDLAQEAHLAERFHIPMTLQQSRQDRERMEQDLAQQKAELHAILANPRAFAKEDQPRSPDALLAQTKLRFLEQWESKLEQKGFVNIACAAGRILADVSALGVAADRRSEFLAALPLHAGELLSVGAVEEFLGAVNRIDPELGVSMLFLENDSVTITVSRPRNMTGQ